MKLPEISCFGPRGWCDTNEDDRRYAVEADMALMGSNRFKSGDKYFFSAAGGPPLPLDEDKAAAPPPERTENRKEAAYQIYRDLILENIEYDTLTQNPRIDREQLDEIVDILLETVCTSRKSIRVAGDDYPAELVKAKFLKLDSHHIEFVMDCLRDNTTKVRNIKQYLRAMLFNAPSTINSYYASLVAHDMAQPDWGRPPNN